MSRWNTGARGGGPMNGAKGQTNKYVMEYDQLLIYIYPVHHFSLKLKSQVYIYQPISPVYLPLMYELLLFLSKLVKFSETSIQPVDIY